MTHGDDGCLLLPPKLAPIQVVIIPIWKKDGDKAEVLSAASSVKESLQTAGIKVKLDESEQRTPGWKFNFWEMKIAVHLCHNHWSQEAASLRPEVVIDSIKCPCWRSHDSLRDGHSKGLEFNGYPWNFRNRYCNSPRYWILIDSRKMHAKPFKLGS